MAFPARYFILRFRCLFGSINALIRYAFSFAVLSVCNFLLLALMYGLAIGGWLDLLREGLKLKPPPQQCRATRFCRSVLQRRHAAKERRRQIKKNRQQCPLFNDGYFAYL